MKIEIDPFRHMIVDGFFSDALIDLTIKEWPSPTWKNWFTYDSLLERKRTCSSWQDIPPICQHLLFTLLRKTPLLGSVYHDTVSDPSLWGAGMCSMIQGEHLDVHLDHDVHPKIGLARRYNSLLFLSDWREEWGGTLDLWDQELTEPKVRILPARNRLVIFETTDISYHSVSPLTCPPGMQRRSLAVHWYGINQQASKRPRAEFVATKNEPYNAEKEVLRQQRRQSNVRAG